MKTQRNLSGIYFRAKRDNKYENICFEDLTEDEQGNILSDYNEQQTRRLAIMLANTLNEVGDELDLTKE